MTESELNLLSAVLDDLEAWESAYPDRAEETKKLIPKLQLLLDQHCKHRYIEQDHYWQRCSICRTLKPIKP